MGHVTSAPSGQGRLRKTTRFSFAPSDGAKVFGRGRRPRYLPARPRHVPPKNFVFTIRLLLRSLLKVLTRQKHAFSESPVCCDMLTSPVLGLPRKQKISMNNLFFKNLGVRMLTNLGVSFGDD